jgi:hypothetical protein
MLHRRSLILGGILLAFASCHAIAQQDCNPPCPSAPPGTWGGNEMPVLKDSLQQLLKDRARATAPEQRMQLDTRIRETRARMQKLNAQRMERVPGEAGIFEQIRR